MPDHFIYLGLLAAITLGWIAMYRPARCPHCNTNTSPDYGIRGVESCCECLIGAPDA